MSSSSVRLGVVLLALFAAIALGVPALAQGDTVYVAYGDSITAGTGDSVPEGPGAGYPARLGDLLGTTVLNRGQSGGTSTDLLNDFSEQVLVSGADVLLLMLGTNDVGREIPIEITLANLDTMQRRAAQQGMSTIHATVIPRWPEARNDPENQLTKILNQQVRNLAGINSRRLVDPFEIFLREPRRYALWYAPREGDRVGHPSPEGYDQIAQAFADVIEGVDEVAPVTGVISPFDGEKRVGRSERILVDLWDFGTGIDPSSVELLVDGQPTGAEPVISGQRAVLTHSPGSMLGKVTVTLRAADQANPANTVDRDIATFFTVQTDFPEGDVNRDGRVDGIDLLVLAHGFGEDPASTLFDPDADLDQDGDIDGVDLAILVDNFGASL